MATQEEQEVVLTRLAQHYTGSEDIQGLLQTTEYQNAFQGAMAKTGGNAELAADLAISQISRATTPDGVVGGWFIGSVSGTNRSGEAYAFSTILLPNGQTRRVDGTLDFGFLAPISISPVTITENYATGETTFRVSKAATVGASDHTTPLPDVAIDDVVTECRTKSSWQNAGLRQNKTTTFGTGTVASRDDGLASVFVNEPTDNWGGAVRIGIESGGIAATLDISPEHFEAVTGLDAVADTDSVREVLAGRAVSFYGELDVTARLPDGTAGEFVTVLAEALRTNTSVNQDGRRVLNKPFEIGPYTVQNLFEGDNGLTLYVDVSELGYTPTIGVSPRTNRTGDAIAFTVPFTFAFDGLGGDGPVVPNAFQGIGAYLNQSGLNSFEEDQEAQ